MPLTYGFRQYFPRASTFLNPWTGATVAYPVLDLSMQQTGVGVLPDRSAYGNNGVVAGNPVGVRGVFDEGQKFDGIDSYASCGNLASLKITGDISASAWTSIQNFTGIHAVMAKNDAWTEGWHLASTNAAGAVSAKFYSGGATVTGVNSIVLNRPAHVGFTVKSNLCRVFLDGLEEAHGTVTMSDGFWNDLLIGASPGPTLYLPGRVELAQEWNGAISPEVMYHNYLQAAAVPILHETLESYAITPVAKTVGSMCGPFRVGFNTAIITVDANGTHWLMTASGGAYSVVSMFLPEPFSYGTFEYSFTRATAAGDVMFFLHDAAAAGLNGYGIIIAGAGSLVMYRYTAGGIVAVPLSAPLVIANDTQYWFRTVRRPGGIWAFYIKGGAFTDWVLVALAADDTYNTSNFVLSLYNYYGTMATSIRQTRVCERPGVVPWEFLSGGWSGVYSGGRSWLYCSVAGVVFLPKDLDWTRCEFGLYKGGAATVIDAIFVASEIGTTATAGQYGYALRVDADEKIQLLRIDNGVTALIAETAAGYVALTTEYRGRITHNGTTNAYDFYIMGGAYTDWTATGLAATLGIYTTSNYMCFDIDASDRLTAPECSRV